MYLASLPFLISDHQEDPMHAAPAAPAAQPDVPTLVALGTMPPSLGTVRRFWVETLGCPKNQVDSDKLTGLLVRDGMAAAERARSRPIWWW